MGYSMVSKTGRTVEGKRVGRANTSKSSNGKWIQRGEVYWADLSGGAKGSEQSGHRPVVILQNNIGNRFSPNVIVACITSQMTKGSLPTHVEVGTNDGLEKDGVVLLEQVRTISKERLDDRILKFNDDKMKELDVALMISLGLEL